MAKTEIRSPLPGVFYRQPSPEEPPYKKAGDTVAKDDVVGLVEVMKTFTEVRADADGTIIAFAAENEEAIVAGQVLVEIEV